MSSGRVTAILLAGGRGDRLGTGVPKQFLDLGGMSVIARCVDTLERAGEVEAIVAVVTGGGDDRNDWEKSEKIVSVTEGGSTRQASLSQGIVCLPEECSVVLVHDAARPLVSPSLVSRLIAALGAGIDGVIPVIAEDDALKEVAEGHVVGFRSKAGLWRAQTPQCFLREPLEDALVRADADLITCEDCSEMLTRAGYRVKAIEGEPTNLKITTAGDFRIAEAILRSGAVT